MYAVSVAQMLKETLETTGGSRTCVCACVSVRVRVRGLVVS